MCYDITQRERFTRKKKISKVGEINDPLKRASMANQIRKKRPLTVGSIVFVLRHFSAFPR